ncbi:MAG: hypothetical protein M0015_00185 [Betaproteobacteria bacterium]|nr:hypothetical protein [Betaproteobacteria bacterium]
MPIRQLEWQWPEALEERGPAQDPSILLTGSARIGQVPVQVVAVRINPELVSTPDYRPDVDKAGYRKGALDTLLETILDESESLVAGLAELLGEGRSSIVPLPQGSYLVWVIPSVFGAAETAGTAR